MENELRNRLEKELIEELNPYVKIILEASSHIIKSGGKRIRPLITIYTGLMFGAPFEKVIKLAIGIEYIHVASLLHDDIVDKAEKRRGKDTVNKLFGSEIAVLTGDYMYAKSLNIYSTYGDSLMIERLSKSVMDMAEGQILELKSVGELIDLETYYKIIDGKTASLIGACFSIGALSANKNNLYLEMESVGIKVGRAFQIIDDILDYEGEEEKLGKPKGLDLKEGKCTLPLILVKDKIDKSLVKSILLSQNLSEEELNDIIEKIKELGGTKMAKDIAKELIEESMSYIENIKVENEIYKNELLSILKKLLNRTY